MRRWRLAALGTGLGVVVACSSFSAADDVQAPDDGGGDSGSDGAVAADGAPADGAAADVGTPPPTCPPGAFCDDFERDSMVADGWDAFSLQSKTTVLSLDKARVLSGLGALRLDIAQGSANSAYLQKTIPSTGTTTISFGLYYDAAPTDDVVVSAINLTGAAVYVVVLPQGTIGFADQTFAPDGGPALTSATTTFPVGVAKWRKVTLGYTSTPVPTLIAIVDGMEKTRAAERVTIATPKHVQIGATSVKAGGVSTFHFDEVVVTTK